MARKKPLRSVPAGEKPIHPLPWNIHTDGSFHILKDADNEHIVCSLNRPSLQRILDLTNASTTLKTSSAVS